MSLWWLLAALAAGFAAGWLVRGLRAQAQLLRVGRTASRWAVQATAARDENSKLRASLRNPAAFHQQLDEFTRRREDRDG